MASSAIPNIGSRPFQPLIWWHLLSLDAPTIAVLWCALFSAAMGVPLAHIGIAFLALGVWSLYVLDRLLDGYDSQPQEHLRERHYFYARHRKIFTPLLMVSAAIGAIALLRTGPILLPAARHDFLALGIFLIIYYALIHALRDQTRWFPKELAVGVFFCCAVAVPTWVRLPVEARWSIVPPIIVLGLLCWLNCVAITRWESEQAVPQHGFKLWALLMTCAAVSLFYVWRDQFPAIFVAVILSTLILAWLDWNRSRFSALSLRVAADCALLTPILVAPLLLH